MRRRSKSGHAHFEQFGEANQKRARKRLQKGAQGCRGERGRRRVKGVTEKQARDLDPGVELRGVAKDPGEDRGVNRRGGRGWNGLGRRLVRGRPERAIRRTQIPHSEPGGKGRRFHRGRHTEKVCVPIEGVARTRGRECVERFQGPRRLVAKGPVGGNQITAEGNQSKSFPIGGRAEARRQRSHAELAVQRRD